MHRKKGKRALGKCLHFPRALFPFFRIWRKPYSEMKRSGIELVHCGNRQRQGDIKKAFTFGYEVPVLFLCIGREPDNEMERSGIEVHCGNRQRQGDIKTHIIQIQFLTAATDFHIIKAIKTKPLYHI